MSFMSQCYLIISDCGFSAPGHGKEVVDGLNAIGNRFIYKLISNVQLPGSKTFDSQILINSSTQNNDVSIAKEFEKTCLKSIRKHGVIDQGKYIKIASKRKWRDKEYHVQDNDDFAHKYVKIYCNTYQLT